MHSIFSQIKFSQLNSEIQTNQGETGMRPFTLYKGYLDDISLKIFSFGFSNKTCKFRYILFCLRSRSLLRNPDKLNRFAGRKT